MNFSDEAECGYISIKIGVEGTSVEYVMALDQAVSYISYIKGLSQNYHTFWDFILDFFKTPGYVITCQADIQAKILKRREN